MTLFGLLETEGFPPRWYCGEWTPLHGWTHILADLAIGAAYLAIPMTLAWFVMRRRDVAFFRSAWFFVAFIFTCGACHLIEASIFWYPWYRLSGAMKVVTAVVSWLTVVELARLLPSALRLPGLDEVNKKLRCEIQERQEAQRRAELLFEVSPNALVTVDDQGQILQANARFKELFPDWGRTSSWCALLAPDQRALLKEASEALEQDRPGPPLVLVLGQGDQEKILEVTLCPIEHQEGREILATLVDTTEEVQARRQLEAVAKELERSNKELEQFAYVASHDLKAPLRAIKTLAGWVRQDSAEVLPAASKRHLEKMEGRIGRMEGFLDDLLEFSRVGRAHLQRSALDAKKAILAAAALADVPGSFQLELPQQLPQVYGHHVPLEQVLRNLLNNAVKHHHLGHGVIKVSCLAQGDWVQFGVQDDGPGVAPGYHQEIFEMFRTLRRRDEVEGSGMGLALVQKIVQSQGGRVWLRSQPGKGSIFYFTWPRAPSS